MWSAEAIFQELVHPSTVRSILLLWVPWIKQRPSDLYAKCFFPLILAAQIHTFRKAPGLCLPRTYRLPHPLWPSASALFFQTHHLPDLSHVGLAGTILREQTYVNVSLPFFPMTFVWLALPSLHIYSKVSVSSERISLITLSKLEKCFGVEVGDFKQGLFHMHEEHFHMRLVPQRSEHVCDPMTNCKSPGASLPSQTDRKYLVFVSGSRTDVIQAPGLRRTDLVLA